MDKWMREDLAVLQAVFPDGVPEEEYIPLLQVLYPNYSDRALAKLVDQLTDKDKIRIQLEDLPKAYWAKGTAAKRQEIKQRLLAAGFKLEEEFEEQTK